MPRYLTLVLAASAAFASAARADVITFNNLTGPQALVVNSYAEGNYIVTPVSGAWGEGHSFGNPVPAIFSSASSSYVDITRADAGTFTFNSVDLGNGGTGSPNFFIQGFLNNNWIFGISSSLPANNSFFTVPSYDTSMQMDMLRITMSLNDTSSYAIDNINLGVPEPASLALLALPAVTLLLRRRGAGLRAAHASFSFQAKNPDPALPTVSIDR